MVPVAASKRCRGECTVRRLRNLLRPAGGSAEGDDEQQEGGGTARIPAGRNPGGDLRALLDFPSPVRSRRWAVFPCPPTGKAFGRRITAQRAGFHRMPFERTARFG